MRRSRSLLALALVGVLAACGTDTVPVATDDEVTDAPDPVDDGTGDGTEDPSAQPADPDDDEAPTGLDVRTDGPTLELVADDGVAVHGWTLDDGTFHSFLVRPDAATGHLDVVAVVLHGERPVLYHAAATPDGGATLAAFPDHLQPAHEVDQAPPAIAWTPDASSLVWTETTGEDLILRTVGWDDGPGTDRTADDNASFALDLPADARVDGFEVSDDGTWTLLLRDGVGDAHEVPVERQADGALAIPAS